MAGLNPELLRIALSMRDRERRRMSDEEEAAAELVKQGVDVKKVKGLFPAARPAFFDVLEEQQKIKKKQEKAQESLTPVQGENVGPLAIALRGQQQLPVTAQQRQQGRATSPAVERAALTADPDARARLLNALASVAGSGRLGELDMQMDVATATEQGQLPSSGTSTEFERLSSRAAGRGRPLSTLERTRLERLAAGSGGLEIITTPNGETIVRTGAATRKGHEASPTIRNELIDSTMRAEQGLALITSAREKIRQSPTSAGFASRIRNAVSRGVGVLQAVDQLAGTNLTSLTQEARSRIESRVGSGQLDPAFELEMLRAEGGEISELEFEEFLLAFLMRDALTPTGRFSFAAVKELQRQLNFKDARGPGDVLRKLGVAERIMRNALKSNRARAKSQGVDLPRVDFDENGKVPVGAVFTLDEDGNVVEVAP